MSFINAITQKVTAVASNSSTSNLSASATFTGISASTLSVAGIQVGLKADQNCTLYIDQSPDGTNWDIVDSYEYNSTAGNFGITVQAISSYFRVRVTNLSATTATTAFRLQSVLCPIVESTPRALDSLGNMRVAVRSIEDSTGHEVDVSPTGTLETNTVFRLAGTMFGAATDATFWTMTSSGAGASAATASAMTTLAGGTDNGGYGQMTSVRSARFLAGVPNTLRTEIRIPTVVVTNTTRRWGMFSLSSRTPQNGAYFELSGAGVLSVVTVKAATPTAVASGSFNGTVNAYTVNTNFHTYQIVAIVDHIEFLIDGVSVHTVTMSTAVLTESLTVPVSATVINTAASAGGTIQCAFASIYRLGEAKSESIYSRISGNAATWVMKLGAGVLHRIIFNNTSGTTMTIYDQTSAATPIIGIVTTATAALGTWEYNLPFSTGLTIVTTGNDLDATVVFE